MKKTVIFGGTFNPVHIGHIEMVQAILSYKDVEKVLLIPTNQPPHKQMPENTPSACDRLNMLNIAFDRFQKVEISKIEIQRQGKSFTVETLKELVDKNPKTNFAIAIGGDMLLSFDKWYCYEEILKIASIIVIKRAGVNISHFNKKLELLKTHKAKVSVIDAQITDVSSSMLRRMISEKKSINDFIPKNILKYIEKNKLYI